MTKEALAVNAVISGEIAIKEDGSVWRLMAKRGRSRVGTPCERRLDWVTSQVYRRISLALDGRAVSILAHRLIWEVANGPVPNGLTINHINGIKDDNRLSNLELATHRQQRRHALDVLKVNRHRPTGSLHPMAKLTDESVLDMRRRFAAGETAAVLAAAFGIQARSVRGICAGATWKHLPIREPKP